MATLPTLHHDSHSFVVRIWDESVDAAVDSSGSDLPASSSWRGSIDHIGTGKRAHFDNVEHLITFMRDSSGLPIQVIPLSDRERSR